MDTRPCSTALKPGVLSSRTSTPVILTNLAELCYSSPNGWQAYDLFIYFCFQTGIGPPPTAYYLTYKSHMISLISCKTIFLMVYNPSAPFLLQYLLMFKKPPNLTIIGATSHQPGRQMWHSRPSMMEVSPSGAPKVPFPSFPMLLLEEMGREVGENSCWFSDPMIIRELSTEDQHLPHLLNFP